MAAVIQPIAAVSAFTGYDSLPPFFLEGTSQTWKKGAPLILASGVVTVAGTDPQAALIGIANANATGTANSPVSFTPFMPYIVFEITVDGTAVGSNAPGTGSLAQSNVGTQYGITVDAATGFWYLTTTKTTVGTNTVATLLGFQTNASSGSNDAGVINGRALVHFNSMVETGGTATALTIWA